MSEEKTAGLKHLRDADEDVNNVNVYAKPVTGQINEWLDLDKAFLVWPELYSQTATIQYQGASPIQLRAWSNIDESNVLSVNSASHDIIQACIRTKGMHKKDLLEIHKIPFLFCINDVTFVNAPNKPAAEWSCPECGKQTRTEITLNNLVFKMPEEKYVEYYNQEAGCYIFDTKNYGEIRCRPAQSVGVVEAVKKWILKKPTKFASDNADFIQHGVYTILDWRGLDNKKLDVLCNDWAAMNPDKRNFIIELLDRVKLVQEDVLKVKCSNSDCGEVVDIPFRLEHGIKGLFRPFQDIDSELL